MMLGKMNLSKIKKCSKTEPLIKKVKTMAIRQKVSIISNLCRRLITQQALFNED
jgi:hypothetical protein